MHVVGGRGGKGLISFESIDNVKQRPIGGHGGRGGDVIIEACASVRDLNQQSRVVHGRDGTDAKGKGNNGRAGRVKIITVPVGTLVKQVTRSYVLEEEALDMGADSVASVGGVSLGPIRHSKSGAPFRERVEVIADLDRHGDRMLAARGGRPGFGNKGSQLKYNEQVGPHVHLPHITGGAGEARYLEMELKSIADVGLVGFPNAGKSSFLGSVSKARPRVADYPFTTLHPTVGTVSARDGYAFTIADIPGLIEGAHEDRGLGHEFLRHVERTRVLVYLIDVSRYKKEVALPEKQRAKLEAAAAAAAGGGDGKKRRGRPRKGAAAATASAEEDAADAGNATAGSAADNATEDGDEANVVALPTTTGTGADDLTGRADAGLSTSDPVQDLRILQAELQLYNPALVAKPSLVVANKMDLPGAKAGLERLRSGTSLPVIEASAKKGSNVGLVIDSLRWLLETQERMASKAAAAASAAAAAAATE